MNKYLQKNKSGVTLIELVIAIAIIGITVAPMTLILNQTLRSYSDAEVMTTMYYVGQFVMESILSADYSVLAAQESDVDYFALCAHIDPYTPTARLYNYSYSVWVDSINPDYSGDLGLDEAKITRTGTNSKSITSNYLRIHVRVDYKSVSCQPGEKSINLWTIVTPAGQGY